MDGRVSPSSSPAGADEINFEMDKEWHLRAAELAEDSVKKYETAADARKTFRLSMLGRLQLQDYREHIAAERNSNEKAKEMCLAAQERKDEAAKME